MDSDNLANNQEDDDDDNCSIVSPTPHLRNNKMHLRARENLKKPSRFEDFEISFISISDVEEPTTYEEAMKSSSSKKWSERFHYLNEDWLLGVINKKG